MLRILIADDEYYARKAMIKKTLQVEPDAQIVGDFENGVQVLEFLETHPGEVDVILTDVRMPKMDGLYLAQYLSEQEAKIEVVIVSGYNEFEYARKAISFGVSNYLVKPVQKEEIREALDKIKRQRKRYDEDVQAMVQGKMIEKTLQYLSIEEIALHEEWRRQFLTPIFRKKEGESCCLAIVQMKQEEDSERENFERCLDNFSAQKEIEFFYFHRYQEYVLFLFGDREEQRKQLESFVYRLNIVEELQITAGVSLAFEKPEQSKKAYQEAVYSINQRLIDGWAAVYAFSPDIKPVNLMDAEKEAMLETAILGRSCFRAEEIAEEMLRRCADSYTLYVTISGMFNLLYRLFCKSSRRDGNEGEHGYMVFSYRTDLYGFQTLEEVISYVKNIISAMCQEEKGHHDIVRQILGYIEKNYQNNISLNELAEHKYFMNSSYLSRLFKNEMGQTFSSYLMDFRMRKAAGLLESNLLKITDIAMLVGYNDVSRFIQYFKKKYDCTPDEYRKKKVRKQEE